MIKREDGEGLALKWWTTDAVTNGVPVHWHTYYEVELVLDGTGKAIINGVEVKLQRGSMTLVSPYDFHSIEADADKPLTIKNFCVRPEELTDDISELFARFRPPYFIDFDENVCLSLCSDYCDLETAMKHGSELRELTVRRKIELIMLRIIEETRVNLIKTPPTYMNGQIEERIQRLHTVVTYINNNYSKPLQREELAALVHVSPNYLSNIFKQTLNISLFEYITECRMKAAKSLIRYSDETISSIVTLVGYSSTSLFYRNFHKYFGVSPTEMAKEKRQKDQSGRNKARADQLFK